MSCSRSVFAAGRIVIAALIATVLIVSRAGALTQSQEMPPGATPFPTPDFHFSDPARDAEYWRLQSEVERTYVTFGRSVDAARRAIYPDPARPSTPAAPGTPAWFHARAAVEQAVRDRRPARDAMAALIAFVTREGRLLSPAEAQYSLAVRQSEEDTILATSDNLTDLLASLAGIRTGQWPP